MSISEIKTLIKQLFLDCATLSLWIINKFLKLVLATTLYCFTLECGRLQERILLRDQLKLQPFFRVLEVVSYESSTVLLFPRNFRFSPVMWSKLKIVTI